MKGNRVAVWDLPVRLFHWSLAALILFAWWSAETHHLDWHKIAGSLVAGLLVFRLWWGFFGGQAARFSDFVRGPGAVWSYLFPGKAKGVFSLHASLGHNPLGALSVIALLLATLVTVIAGLFAEDVDELDPGPFEHFLTYDQAQLASKIHGYAFQALEILVVLHLLAIAWYTLRRKGLIGAMIHGNKTIESETAPLKKAQWWSLLIGLALGGATAAYLIHLSAQA